MPSPLPAARAMPGDRRIAGDNSGLRPGGQGPWPPAGLCPEMIRDFAPAVRGRGRPGNLPVGTGNREFGGAFFCLVKRKPPGPRKKYRFFAFGNRPTPGCRQMPPMLSRGQPRTNVGYGRRTGPGARPFRYVAAVAGLVTGRGLTLSGKAKSRIISGDTPPNSRTVTIRAGQKPTESYEPRLCAEDNVAVKAASDRQTSVSCLRQKKAPFFRGPGGFLCASSKESPPNCRAPYASSRSNPAGVSQSRPAGGGGAA